VEAEPHPGEIEVLVEGAAAASAARNTPVAELTDGGFSPGEGSRDV
jgi:hypothetical protein